MAVRIKPGETEVASDTWGLWEKYDLYLVRTPADDYRLVVYMKVQFFFEDDDAWTKAAKRQFVTRWEQAVQSRWGNRTVKHLKNGKRVSLEFQLDTQIEGWMWDHWEISVTRIPKGAFRTSSVNWLTKNVTLDSEDLVLTPKGRGHRQRGAVHEFGHMLGLDDEYLPGGPHVKDYRSVMNRGEQVLGRHDTGFLKWLDEQLEKEGVE